MKQCAHVDQIQDVQPHTQGSRGTRFQGGKQAQKAKQERIKPVSKLPRCPGAQSQPEDQAQVEGTYVNQLAL